MIREYYPSFFFFFLRRQIRKCVLKPTDYYYFRDFKECTAFIVSFFCSQNYSFLMYKRELFEVHLARPKSTTWDYFEVCATTVKYQVRFIRLVFFCASFLFYWDGTSRRTFFPDARFDLRSSVVLSLFSWIKSRQSWIWQSFALFSNIRVSRNIIDRETNAARTVRSCHWSIWLINV